MVEESACLGKLTHEDGMRIHAHRRLVVPFEGEVA